MLEIQHGYDVELSKVMSDRRVNNVCACPTLFDPMDCSSPGSSVHGILQRRVLEWVAMPSSSISSQSRDQTLVTCIADGFFTS